jgi:hypothetical protein
VDYQKAFMVLAILERTSTDQRAKGFPVKLQFVRVGQSAARNFLSSSIARFTGAGVVKTPLPRKSRATRSANVWGDGTGPVNLVCFFALPATISVDWSILKIRG